MNHRTFNIHLQYFLSLSEKRVSIIYGFIGFLRKHSLGSEFEVAEGNFPPLSNIDEIDWNKALSYKKGGEKDPYPIFYYKIWGSNAEKLKLRAST